MEGQSPASDSQYRYISAPWPQSSPRDPLAPSSLNHSPLPPPSSLAASSERPIPINIFPVLLPHDSSYHQAQLAHYNRLIASGRATRIQSSPLPPVLTAHHIQAVPGSRSGLGSGSTARNTTSSVRIGHGNNESNKSSKGESALIVEKENPSTMPAKKFELSAKLSTRPLPLSQQHSSNSHQSSSVPSTPHHHTRNFSFQSREPSPTPTTNHSPRSAYSESNLTLPSSRPLPPPRGGCRYETAMAHTKRRMPYNIGSERLEKRDAKDVKSKLSEDEERKLTTDMRDLYDRLLPTPEVENKKEKLVRKLEKLFNDQWPGHDIQVHMFGSTGNLLCTDTSDVDVCITTDWKKLEAVCKIADLLAKNGMKEVICVSTAKVPIVKIMDPEVDIACDMNVNNTLALENTRMIKTYVQIDSRVRPLAMIIKHWTRRRIVNDAAFGGTLSSYTWICMIINFLQSRNPPVLPSLHQRPHLKLPRKDGNESDFADDLDALRGFGNKNKETLGELLFGFFKFYAHDFDYDNLVISVRSGKQISKTEKMWHLGNNNMLCVEEPFNVNRNLGNTADETSFRGLHMELRRAFDLVSAAKLEECCEQYEFPKDEKPPPRERQPARPKPAIIRSASQTQSHSQSPRSSRGGHRGGRHNNQRNGNNNRRASSAAFENPPGYPVAGLPSNIFAVQDAWLHQQAQAQLHNDLFQTYSVLQAQENSLRLQLYNQSQAYIQAQNQNQKQGFALPQTRGSGGIAQQPTDRNQTNPFDQSPHTAPPRPEMFFYPVHYNATPLYGYQAPSTNPSSPSMSSAVPELRRSMHRSSVTSGSGPSRSHSQPAARSAPSPMLQHGPRSVNQFGIQQSYRFANGIPVPNFIADENSESGFETPTESLATTPPDEGTSREYVGYYVKGPSANAPRRDPAVPMAIPAFGDIQQNGRRLSTDQLQQSILYRLRRPSRSPSPLGHDRSYSTGASSAPLTSVSSQQGVSTSNLRSLNNQIPLVVDGSNIPAPISIPQWQASVSQVSTSEDQSVVSASGSMDSGDSGAATELPGAEDASGQPTPKYSCFEKHLDPPAVANGSNSENTEPATTCGTPPIVNGASFQPSPPSGSTTTEQGRSIYRLSPNDRIRSNRQVQTSGTSPLGIGFTQIETHRDDISHLSPVYEARTPSPTANRKIESSLDRKLNGSPENAKTQNPWMFKPGKLGLANGNQIKQAPIDAKVNGHSRNSKSEGGAPGSWQKIPKGKKKGLAADFRGVELERAHGEKPPNDLSERKGG